MRPWKNHSRLNPNDPVSHYHYVRSAVLQADWHNAWQRLAAAQSVFPDDDRLSPLAHAIRMGEAESQSRSLGEDGAKSGPEAQPAEQSSEQILGEEHPASVDWILAEQNAFSAASSDEDTTVGETLSPGEAVSEIAMRFESLGGGGLNENGWAFGCEFGYFQRHAGVEPLGLLRWASIAPEKSCCSSRCRFRSGR